MKMIWIAAVAIALSGSMGCGGSEARTADGAQKATTAKRNVGAVLGTYLFQETREVQDQLAKSGESIDEIRKAAEAGDKAAQRTLEGLPKDVPTQKRLLAGMKLQVRQGGDFSMSLPEATTGKVREATGTWALDETGTKLTLTISKIDGETAEGPDAKSLAMIFDEATRTLTMDPAGGPKLVMKKR